MQFSRSTHVVPLCPQPGSSPLTWRITWNQRAGWSRDHPESLFPPGMALQSACVSGAIALWRRDARRRH
eukprot:1082828-Prymnesium_polylepis.1